MSESRQDVIQTRLQIVDRRLVRRLFGGLKKEAFCRSLHKVGMECRRFGILE